MSHGARSPPAQNHYTRPKAVCPLLAAWSCARLNAFKCVFVIIMHMQTWLDQGPLYTALYVCIYQPVAPPWTTMGMGMGMGSPLLAYGMTWVFRQLKCFNGFNYVACNYCPCPGKNDLHHRLNNDADAMRKLLATTKCSKNYIINKWKAKWIKLHMLRTLHGVYVGLNESVKADAAAFCFWA